MCVWGGKAYFILRLSQLFLQLFDAQAKLLHLTLVLLHPPVGVGQLGHFLLALFLELGVDVLQVGQFLERGKAGASASKTLTSPKRGSWPRLPTPVLCSLMLDRRHSAVAREINSALHLVKGTLLSGQNSVA